MINARELLILSILLLRYCLISAQSLNWYQTSLSTSWDYTTIASSSSGQYLVAGGSNFAIYVSANYGLSWTENYVQDTAPYEYNFAWSSIDCSGQFMYMTQQDYVYYSHNYGLNWSISETSVPCPSIIASSCNGQYVAMSTCGSIWTSNSFGVTWVETSSGGNGWYGFVSDSTGQYLAGSTGYQSLYTSNDYGVNWNLAYIPDFGNIYCLACNASGNFMIVGTDIGNVGISTDFGQTWTVTSLPSADWFFVASNANGQVLVAVTTNDGYNEIYVSTSGGANWTLQSNDGLPQSDWNAFALNADGDHILAAGSNSNGVWMELDNPTSFPTSLPSNYPSSYPSSQPSRSPTTRPSVQPSAYPSAQPITLPTSYPTCWPSSGPTSQPTSFPSFVLIESKTVVSTEAQSTFVFSNIDQAGAVYLEIVLISYLDTSLNGFVNFTANNGTNLVLLAAQCAPSKACGSTTCLINYDIKSMITTADGGSLKLIAMVNDQNVVGLAPYCTYGGQDNVQFVVTYTLTTYLVPTGVPTFAPTAVTNDNTLNKVSGGPFYAIALFTLAYVALGVVLVRLRDKTTSLAPFSMISACIGLGMIGYHLITEIFYLYVLLSQYSELYTNAAGVLIVFRILCMVPAGYFILCLFGPSSYSEKYSTLIDSAHLSKNIPTYATLLFVMMFDSTIVKYLPWKKSSFIALCRGFPDEFFFKTSMSTKTVNLIVSLIVQIIVFVSANATLLNHGHNSSLLALFILYLTASVLSFVMFVFVVFIQWRLVDTLTLDKSENPMTRETEMRPSSSAAARNGEAALVRLDDVESRLKYLEERDEYLTKRDAYLTQRVTELERLMSGTVDNVNSGEDVNKA